MDKELTLALGMLVLAGCTQATPATSGAPRHGASVSRIGERELPQAPGDPGIPVIVHIVSRDRIVTVKSGPRGLLYSMRGNRNEVLLADASAETLEQSNPQLLREIRQYMAVQADPGTVGIASSARD